MPETAPEAETDANTNTNANANAGFPTRPSNAGVYMGGSGRKSSSNTRINEILENARERAQSMAAVSPTNRSPPAAGSPVLPPNLAPKPGPVNENRSADEATGFISHTPPLNYNSLDVASTATSTPGAHKQPSRNLRQRPSSLRNSNNNGNANGNVPNTETSRQAESENETRSWWRRQADKFQSIELENKGSVARDHLAIERTFLAWLRTSLSFLSVGVAVTQLFRLNTSLDSGNDGGKNSSRNAATLRHMGKPLGTTFIGISILILFLGYNRYFQSQHWVIQGKFPASRGTIMIVAFVALAIMVISLIVIVAIQPSQHEL